MSSSGLKEVRIQSAVAWFAFSARNDLQLLSSGLSLNEEVFCSTYKDAQNTLPATTSLHYRLLKKFAEHICTKNYSCKQIMSRVQPVKVYPHSPNYQSPITNRLTHPDLNIYHIWKWRLVDGNGNGPIFLYTLNTIATSKLDPSLSRQYERTEKSKKWKRKMLGLFFFSFFEREPDL